MTALIIIYHTCCTEEQANSAWSQLSRTKHLHMWNTYNRDKPCRVGSVGSMSASRTVGREFASRPGHTKDGHKNGTNCLPA